MKFRKCDCGNDIQIDRLNKCIECSIGEQLDAIWDKPNAQYAKHSPNSKYAVTSGNCEFCESIFSDPKEYLDIAIEAVSSLGIRKIMFKECEFHEEFRWGPLNELGIEHVAFLRCKFAAFYDDSTYGMTSFFYRCTFTEDAFFLYVHLSYVQHENNIFIAGCTFEKKLLMKMALISERSHGIGTNIWISNSTIKGDLTFKNFSRLRELLMINTSVTQRVLIDLPDDKVVMYGKHSLALASREGSIISLVNCSFESEFKMDVGHRALGSGRSSIEQEECFTFLKYTAYTIQASSNFLGSTFCNLGDTFLIDFSGSTFGARTVFDIASKHDDSVGAFQCGCIFEGITMLDYFDFRGGPNLAVLSFDGVDVSNANLLNLNVPKLSYDCIYSDRGEPCVDDAYRLKVKRGICSAEMAYSTMRKRACDGYVLAQALEFSAAEYSNDPDRYERHMIACRSLARNYAKGYGAYLAKDLYSAEVEAQTACLRHEEGNRFKLLLWRLYGLISGYGENAFRPLAVLLMLLVVFWGSYVLLLSSFGPGSYFDPGILLKGLTISVGATFLRGAQIGQDIQNHDWILLLSYFQATLSIIVIALLVFAVRRHFSKK